MDVTFSDFLGRDLILPGDRLYDPMEGLWIKREDDERLAVGMTEPTVLMGGTVREIEALVEDGRHVEPGDTVLLALTGKLKYLGAPVAGTLIYSADLASLPQKIGENPYEATLFHIVPDKAENPNLLDASGYATALKDSDGARNPGGHKGGASPTCKAVYAGLGEQTIKENT